jgi:fibronectin-binding autotransporter adhesin
VTIGTGGAIKYTGGGDLTDRTLKLQGTGGMTLYSSGSGALIWTGPISSTFTGNRILSIRGSNAGTNELRGNLADNGANALLLSKIDSGRWILSGTNSYSGGTTLSDGTLVFARTNSMPASGTIAVNGGTTLGIRLGGVDEFTTGSSSGSLAGLLAGLGGQGAPVTYANNVTLQVDTVNASAGQTNMANMANLGTTLALIKEGAGELTLSGTNSYTGSTTVNGGTLRFVNYKDLGDIGSASIQINNGATLDIYSDVGAGAFNRWVLNNKTGTFGSTGGGTINFNKGNNLFQGGDTHTFVTTGGSQNAITSSNGGYMNMQGAGTITFTVADGAEDVDLVLSAKFDNGYISKNGAGTLSIQGTHTGNYRITINQGMLDVGGSGRLNAGTFTAAIVNNGIFRYSSGADQVLSGIMSGTGGLLKTGSGTLTLSATNSYTGATSVSNGVLKLTLPEALASDTAVNISTTTGAKIELNFSGTVTVKSLTVDGELLTRNKVYSFANLPNVLSGGGSLYTLEGTPPKGTMIRFF